MKEGTAIHWFRQDLRLQDNPSLVQAASHGHVLPVYILDTVHAKNHAMGGASRWWAHHSLVSLQESLGGMLSVYHGDPLDVLQNLIKRFGVKAVYWNRCYEPWRMHRDKNIKHQLREQGIHVHSYNGSLLWEPWEVTKSDSTPYKVFTPFYRKGCLQAEKPRGPLPPPQHPTYLWDDSTHINHLKFLPSIPWDQHLMPHWTIGEKGAHARFQEFLATGLSFYKQGRDFPDKPYVSRISPHLHFGEISPHFLWHSLQNISQTQHTDHFCSELGWREFAHNQLYFFPSLPTKNLQPKFDAFSWKKDPPSLRAWKKGKTGVPMVDAGMRELWNTGYMHNRMRMIVGSFLVKNLRMHWHHGEEWFWDTLVDADLANNSAGWQWIAGCGADAAPYFRIFNPVTQGEKFDPEGCYVRRFIPEIASLPNKYLFCPWNAPPHLLASSGIALGSTYPLPVVDLQTSRNEALQAFQALKST